MSVNRPQGPPRGFFTQLRSQHWSIRLILVFVFLVVGSPVISITFVVAHEVAGGSGTLVVGGAIAVAAGWFLFNPPTAPAPKAGALRYCESCGAGFEAGACPGCGAKWVPPQVEETPAALGHFLNLVTAEYEDNRLDALSYRRIRDRYAARLQTVLLRRELATAEPLRAGHAPVGAQPPPATVGTPPRPSQHAAPTLSAQPATVVPTPTVAQRAAASATIPPSQPAGPPRRSSRELSRAAIGWAAERQADILLYVGAFLLSTSAIIFVAVQGESVDGVLRFAILSTYALAFLGLGFGLHRWERVKEAGPVFLALGAILVPMDFIALRTQVLSNDQLPTDVLWLVASGTCALLYFALATRGYGTLYAVPGTPAALAAWGSLGSVLNLPVEWFGPWFVLVAAAGYLAASALRSRWRPAKWLLGLSVVLGGAAIFWTQLATLATGDQPGALPAAYLVGTAAVGAGFYWRRDTPALMALPALASLAAASAWWAAFGLAMEWRAPFVAAAGAGYLVVAHFRPEPQARSWAMLAALGGIAALGVAHADMAFADVQRGALPATYAVVFASAAGAFGRWRWAEAGAVLPPLAAMTLVTTQWAARGVNTEWLGAFAGIAALGYLALAVFDRPVRTRGWQTAATVSACIGPLMAHAAIAANGDANRWALTAAYLPPLLGAATGFLRWRWTWRVVPGALPALVAMAGITIAWAQWDLPQEWFPAFTGGAGLGYLLLAQFDDERMARAWAGLGAAAAVLAVCGAHALVIPEGASHAALPVTYGIVLVGVGAAFGRWRWPESAAVLPPAAALTALTTLWAAIALGVEWYGCFSAAAALGYLLLTRFDGPGRLAAWQGGSVGAALVALTLAHATAAADTTPEHAALPVTYGVILAGAMAASFQWRLAWRVAPGAMPLLAALTALTGLWAGWDMRVWWFGAFAAAAGSGYVLLAAADEQVWKLSWLRMGGFVVGAGLALAQITQIQLDAVPLALPVAYGIGLAVAVMAVARFRLSYRDGLAAVPALAAAFGASLAWAMFDMRLEWLPTWAAFAAAGYAIPTIFDGHYGDGWRTLSLVLGIGAMLASHRVALVDDAPSWQLAAGYLMLLIGWTVQAIALRDISTLLPPVLAAALGATVLWAAEIGPEWWPYPAIGIAGLMMLTSRWWERNRVMGSAWWLYAAVLGPAAAVAALPFDYSHPAHGLAVQLLAASLLLFASFRAGGKIAAVFKGEASGKNAAVERAVLTQASFAFVFGAGAALNGVLDLQGAERAWVFTGPASLGWILAAARVRGRAGLRTFAPVGMAGMTVAAMVAAPSDSTVTAVLALATLGPLAAFAGTRRWMFLGIAESTLFLGVWTGWRWQEFDMALIPLAFAAIAAAEWAALTTLRKYTARPGESDLVVTYISWAPWLLAVVVSGLLLSQRQQGLPAGDSLVKTEEWGLAAAVLGMASASIAAEGLRLMRRWVWIPGTIGLLGALLMAIATRQPENVQAYCAPTGIYLVAVALTFRASPRFFREQMCLHEAVMIVGSLALVLPPAEQSFAPGGGKFGLELLGVGLGILAAGLLLHARWLVPVAVTTLTATALRMVTGGLFSTPYWLLLGVAGTLLLLLGLLVLLERERWDRFRTAVVDWWKEASKPEPPGVDGPKPQSD